MIIYLKYPALGYFFCDLPKLQSLQDSVNALQLLEFNLKLEKVQAQHRDCIYALKAFWNALRRSGRELKQDAEHVIQQVLYRSSAN
jgi:hypothetical protein